MSNFLLGRCIPLGFLPVQAGAFAGRSPGLCGVVTALGGAGSRAFGCSFCRKNVLYANTDSVSERYSDYGCPSGGLSRQRVCPNHRVLVLVLVLVLILPTAFGASVCLRRWPFLALASLAFPWFVIGLLASPLCGAGTYFSLPP
ncbi:hypothetical protein, partial [Paraburkholderia fungorum]|uniref:hypothetical protein n=1 Tax=Paraburkholderia fungorum TaxID=134537 RepID=UPI0038BDB4BF